VEFDLVFWASRNDEDSLLAEVQRTNGEPYLFYPYVQRIVDAIRGNEDDLEPLDPLDVDMEDAEAEQQCIDTLFLRCIQDTDPIPSVDEDIRAAIDRDADMLKQSNHYGSVRMALEDIRSMTCVHTSGFRVAKTVATVVLNNTSTIITETVATLAANAGNSNNSHWKHLEFCALTILRQSVNLVDATVLEEFFIGLYPATMQSLWAGAVHSNTHIAYLATHILSVLRSHGETGAAQRLPLRRMQLVGTTSHAALANATARLLQCMAA